MGLLDFLFGKKVKLEIPDKNGKLVKKKISEKMFDELVAQGKIKHVDTVKAHVLDPIRGYYIADWLVDDDVHREDVEKFATPTGELYVVIAYEDGKPQTMLTEKEAWEKQRSIFDLIDKGEDYQEQLDAHISDLKKKINDNELDLTRPPGRYYTTQGPSTGEFDPLVWEASTLAKVSLVPFVNGFPRYAPIVESNLMEAWDHLMTIAMTGVAAHSRKILSDPQAREELKRSLNNWWRAGGEVFEDYYEYTGLRTTKAEAPWAGVSAMWVADNLRVHSKAVEVLKRNASRLDFINPLAAFMNMSFGSSEFGLSHYLGIMALEVEKEMGIDMGLGTNGTKKDPAKKIQALAELFESFARKTVELIAERNQ